MAPRPAAETSSGQVVHALPARRLLPRLATPAALPLVLAGAAAWPLWRGIDHRFISFSDGAYTYIASVVAARGGDELYHSVVLSQPPGIVLGAALAWRMSPHIETIRVVLAALSALTAVLTYALGRTIGLRAGAASLAALVALTAPVHAQFTGLDGEAILTPLALGVALALERRAFTRSGLLLGLGLFVKATWAPFLLAGAIAAARAGGRKALVTSVAAAVGTAATLYGLAIAAFGWSIGDLVTQIALAETKSGLQLAHTPILLLIVVVLWWPLLLLARSGLAALSPSARLLAGAGALSTFYMVKQGTYFNVLDPLEPFLAIAAIAGGSALWRRRGSYARAVVVVSAAGLALHVASVSRGSIATRVGFALGAALRTDNEAVVDQAARAIATHSRPDEPVLVNPLFAVAAQRREVGDQADWFILDALQRYCVDEAVHARHCVLWSQMKRAVREGRVPVLTVDANVESFDKSFRSDTGVASLERAFHERTPPIITSVYWQGTTNASAVWGLPGSRELARREHPKSPRRG